MKEDVICYLTLEFYAAGFFVFDPPSDCSPTVSPAIHPSSHQAIKLSSHQTFKPLNH
jgi:hypothetical protein